MRFVRKDPKSKPASLNIKKIRAHWHRIIVSRRKNLIKSSIYCDSYETTEGRRSRVIDILDQWYFQKCAYCEKICKADVEHYRPSKAVKDINNKPIKGHNGYYWLCYEWSNLLPSCPNCNREGGKHNKFPVQGRHVFRPKITKTRSYSFTHFRASSLYLTSESPLLLHPEIDKPEKYFHFEIDPDNEGIRIVGVDPGGRGEHTIQICLLNRLELKIARHREVVSSFVDSIHAAFTQQKRGTITRNEFRNQINGIIQSLYDKAKNKKYAFTLFRKFVVKKENFTRAIIPYVRPELRAVITTAFENYVPK
jgi:hypothetical protein